MAFPLAPTNGQLFTDPQGKVWKYTTVTTKWESVSVSTVNNYAAITAPGATDDSTLGYSPGSIWVDLVANNAYTCVDSTATLAIWKQTNGGGGVLNNFTAVTNPTVTDDSSGGYSVGSVWINTAASQIFVATDVTLSNASWTNYAAALVSNGTPSPLVPGLIWFDASLNAYRCTISNTLWITQANMNTARSFLAGAGTSSSALSFGGSTTGGNSAATELYTGASWSAQANMNIARYGLAGAGTSSSTLSFGGWTTVNSAITELYNGTSWATQANMNVAVQRLAGAGTSSSALSFGGLAFAITATTELYNGVSWTVKASMNNARSDLAGSGGSATSALSFGGSVVGTGATGITELYNGTSWATQANLNTARFWLAGAGTSSLALSFGGFSSSAFATTELFNGSIWGAQSGMNTARYTLAGAGISSDALSFGGATPGVVLGTTELFQTIGLLIKTFTIF